MKKIIVLLIALFLVGCSAQAPLTDDVEALSILAPKGAPALTLITYANQYGSDNLTLVDGTDVISAALVNPTPEYDVIIAPINLGAITINKGSEYRLLGVITWGNLYLVANTDLVDSDLPIAMFGEGAVPQIVVDASIDLTEFGKDVQYYNSVADVQVALLTQSASYGLLAEPALTATLAKASAAGINLEVVSDIQMEYNAKNGTSGYPQAAVFVLNSTYEAKTASYDELVSYLSDLNVENVTALLSGNEETYGVPSAAIITQAWDGMNIEYKGYKDVETEISAFLQLFNIDSSENMFVN